MAEQPDHEPITVEYAFEKETKNTIMYKEVVPIGGDPVAPQLYLKKDAVKRLGNPERVKITVVNDDYERHVRPEV